MTSLLIPTYGRKITKEDIEVVVLIESFYLNGF